MYGFHAALNLGFDAAVLRVVEALKAEGFSVLSRARQLLRAHALRVASPALRAILRTLHRLYCAPGATALH